MKIFISGSMAYDRIMNFPGKFEDHILPEKIHMLNVSFTVQDLSEKYGGTAGNIAYSLALLGEKPLILATVGQDFDRYEQWLKKNNLSMEGIRRISDKFTACAYITTDMSDNQITGFNLGAMQYPSQYSFKDISPGNSPGNSLGIIAPGSLEDMLSYSRFYKEKKIPYIFDPGQSIPILDIENMKEMISGAMIFISNDYEIEMVKKSTNLSDTEILARCGAVITTLGEKGSIVHTKGKSTKIPALEVENTIDPTGAGDAFRSGLIKGLVMKKDYIEAARLGAICASFAVEHLGTQEHYFDEKIFNKRYTGLFGKI